MFHYEKCSHRASHRMNHDRNMFIFSMIETTSRGCLDLSQTKHVSTNVVSLLNTALPIVPEEQHLRARVFWFVSNYKDFHASLPLLRKNSINYRTNRETCFEKDS